MRWLMGLAILFSSVSAYSASQNFYSYAVYEIMGKSGRPYNMNVISKASNMDVCNAAASSNLKKLGKWTLLESNCVTGEEYDEAFEAVFNNRPLLGVYLSYQNLSGLETRVNFVGVAGADSPVPGFPLDLPVDLVRPLINDLRNQLNALGIKKVDVVYPES